MQTKPFSQSLAFLLIAFSAVTLTGCTASSQGSSSRSFDAPINSGVSTQPSMATVPTLNLDISVDGAYAAIPHRRTAMDFAASSMPDDDKRFLEVAFHVIDQAIRLRVTAFQKFANGDRNSQLMLDMDTLFEYYRASKPPLVYQIIKASF